MDRRRIVTLDSSLTPTTVVDLEDGTLLYHTRDSWKITPGIANAIESTRSRPRAGSRRVDERHTNGTLTGDIAVKGATAAAALDNAENLFSILRSARTDLYYEWRADGATNSTFYEIRGAAQITPTYSRVLFAQVPMMTVTVEIPIGPMAVSGKSTVSVPDFTAPAVFPLGTIPGTAPAIGDVITTNNSGAALPFALIAWAQKSVFNMIYNGGFETAGGGWSTAAVSPFTVASTSTQRQLTTPRTGFAQMTVVTTATNLSGATERLFYRFRSGVTYTIEAWVRSGTAGEAVQLFIGSIGTTADVAITGTVTLSTTYQKLTTTWTPTADRTDAVVGVRINDATPVATTILVDDVAVYEGTTAPAYPEGRRPFGVMAAGAGEVGTWTVTAGGQFGSYMQITTGGSGFIESKMGYILPALMMPDDYTDTVEIEAWGMFNLAATVVTPMVTLSYWAEGDPGYKLTPSENPTTGKQMVVPNGGTAYRLTRLGTVTFPVDPSTPTKWLVDVLITYAAGSSGTLGFDYLLLVPARRRALSPTGKVNDSTYPVFANSADQKTIYGGDLSGAASFSGINIPRPGLGGSPIELPAGVSMDMLVAAYSTVPDDPTANSIGNLATGAAMTGTSVNLTQRRWLVRGA